MPTTLSRDTISIRSWPTRPPARRSAECRCRYTRRGPRFVACGLPIHSSGGCPSRCGQCWLPIGRVVAVGTEGNPRQRLAAPIGLSTAGHPALAKVHGCKGVVGRPLYKGYEVAGSKIMVAFDEVGSGLMITKLSDVFGESCIPT